MCNLFSLLLSMLLVCSSQAQLTLTEQQGSLGSEFVSQSYYGGSSGILGLHYHGYLSSRNWLLDISYTYGIRKTNQAFLAYDKGFQSQLKDNGYTSANASIGRYFSQRGDSTHMTRWSLQLGAIYQIGYLKPSSQYQYAYTEDSLVKAVYYRGDMSVALGLRYQIRNQRPNGGFSNHLFLLQAMGGIPTETRAYTFDGSTYESYYGPKFRGFPLGANFQYRWYYPFSEKWGIYAGYQFTLQPYGRLPEPQAPEFTNTGGTRLLTAHQFSIGIGSLELFDRKKE